MADLSITSSSVIPQANAVIARGTAGVAISAGQLVYMDASANNQLKLAANTSAATAAVVGIAVNSAANANQPLEYVTSGDVELNSVLTLATVYVMGSGAGTISIADDLHDSTGSARYGTVVGICTSTSPKHILRVAITPSGVQNP